MIGLVIGLVIYFGRTLIAEFYTNIEEIVVESNNLFRFFAVFYSFDCAMCIQCGIMRGMGKTWQSTITALISYYTIGIPIEIMLVFKFRMGLMGLWVGQFIGLFIHTAVQ